jgi:hypothetical protein
MKKRLTTGLKIHEYFERGVGPYMRGCYFKEALNRMRRTGCAAAEVKISGVLKQKWYNSRIDRLEFRNDQKVLRICEIKTGKYNKYVPSQFHRRQLAVYLELVKKQLTTDVVIETCIYYIKQTTANQIIENCGNTFLFEVIHVDCTNYEL